MREAGSISYEERGGVARVTLDRATKRNALTAVMLERLAALFAGMDARTDLRAVILYGRGDAAFCAGTDISELSALDAEGARRASERGQRVCALVEECPVPVICAVDGLAAGGGFELALACHLRVASERARFLLPETRLGLLPAYGGTQRLSRIVGEGRALAVMLAGAEITAGEALRIGLVNRITAPDACLDEAEALALAISEQAPLAVRACLEAVTQGTRLPLAEGLALEARLFSRLFDTSDAREGTRAFLEKRPPEFKGE